MLTILEIFKKKHPNYIVILVFDYSFIYILYKERALNAFNINFINISKKLTLKDMYYLLECII